MLRWGMILLFLPSILLVGHYTIELQDAGQCVYAKGSWDYLKGVCDHNAQHELIPYMERFGWIVNSGMLLSVIGLLMTTWGMILRGMGRPKDE